MSSMTHALLFAATANWVASWLTPLWLVGVGALLGLAILVGLWLIGWGASRIPTLARIGESPRQAVRK